MTLSRRSFSVSAISLLVAACASHNGTPNKGIVLVAGATGGTGKHLIAQLQAQGYSVRALARDAAKAKSEIVGPYEWAQGDVRDGASLSRALAGVRYVISSVGATEKEGPNSPEKVDWEGGHNLIDASKTAKVERFVLISSASAGNPESPLNKIFGNVLIWKGKAEDYLRHSGLTYTIVRGPGLLDEPGGQKAIALEQEDTKSRRVITREDLASVTIAAISSPSARRKTFVARNLDGPANPEWAKQFANLKKD